MNLYDSIHSNHEYLSIINIFQRVIRVESMCVRNISHFPTVLSEVLEEQLTLSHITLSQYNHSHQYNDSNTNTELALQHRYVSRPCKRRFVVVQHVCRVWLHQCQKCG